MFIGIKMKSNVRVAAIQMISTDNVTENLNQAQQYVRQAADEGAQLIVLPEYFCIMGQTDQDKLAIAETLNNGPIQSFLSDLAQDLGVWIGGGTIPIKTSNPEKIFNTHIVFNNKGESICHYNKIHLFGFERGAEKFDESKTILPGNQPVTFEGPAGKTGVSICYDLRFPELYRSMGAVNLIVVPSAFTHTTGMAHWLVLLRARAIENQCYVLAPAQGGLHNNGRKTWGHSMLINPWGEVMAQIEEGPGVVIGNVDFAHLNDIRQVLPALKHRIL
jgi:predicted amidohydrolase